jgi:hypothetical protein
MMSDPSQGGQPNAAPRQSFSTEHSISLLALRGEWYDRKLSRRLRPCALLRLTSGYAILRSCNMALAARTSEHATCPGRTTSLPLGTPFALAKSQAPDRRLGYYCLFWRQCKRFLQVAHRRGSIQPTPDARARPPTLGTAGSAGNRSPRRVRRAMPGNTGVALTIDCVLLTPIANQRRCPQRIRNSGADWPAVTQAPATPAQPLLFPTNPQSVASFLEGKVLLEHGAAIANFLGCLHPCLRLHDTAKYSQRTRAYDRP